MSVLRIVKMGAKIPNICGVCEEAQLCGHFDHDLQMAICGQCDEVVKVAEFQLRAWLYSVPMSARRLAILGKSRPLNARRAG